MEKQKLFVFDSNLFFTPDCNEIIYIEDSFNEKANQYIQEHYETIINDLKDGGYNFVYYPKQIETLLEHQEIEVIHYYYPNKSIRDIQPDTAGFYGWFGQNLFDIEKCIPYSGSGFLIYKEQKDSYHVFEFHRLSDDVASEVLQLSEDYGGKANGDEYFSFLDEYYINGTLDEQGNDLIEEVQERINRLEQLGISNAVLKSIFFPEQFNQKPSRMVITRDYRIILPDYHNLEIKMAPLPKAIYFLFLRHPDGILFKHLPDYREVLRWIYSQISNRENQEEMIKSIQAVTDPTNNSINEKCSRIREVFIREFDESIAKYYFVTGESSRPKRIILDRDLVEWETKTFNLIGF
jgi:hypothetical protein